MTRIFASALLMMGAAMLGSAEVRVPEIDPGLGVNALALLGGAVLVVRSGLKK